MLSVQSRALSDWKPRAFLSTLNPMCLIAPRETGRNNQVASAVSQTAARIGPRPPVVSLRMPAPVGRSIRPG